MPTRLVARLSPPSDCLAKQGRLFVVLTNEFRICFGDTRKFDCQSCGRLGMDGAAASF